MLGKRQNYNTWSQTFSTQFEQLKQQAASGIPSLLDYYGATNPAEFFAVASEVFFEQSEPLSRQYPKLYQQLSQYYQVDPLHW